MALFEIIIELPVGSDIDILTAAASQTGYDDAKISRTDTETLFNVLIRHPMSSFETGNMLAEQILQHLPLKAKYHSHRSSVLISEMSSEDLDVFLKEIESSQYGKTS
jgi:hypothetical protein